MTTPQVFVVDTCRSSPAPVPLQTRRLPRKLLHMLVGLALLGVLVEACFIYHLYLRTSGVDSRQQVYQVGSESVSAQRGYNNENFNVSKMSPKELRKPSAHLTGKVEGKELTWERLGDYFVHDMDAVNGRLLVRKEGYYFLYSKVLFAEPKCSQFKHIMSKETPRYPGKLELMKTRRFYCHNQSREEVHSSYLGGVFHLFSGDSVVVTVKNSTQIRMQDTTENFFGAFMI